MRQTVGSAILCNVRGDVLGIAEAVARRTPFLCPLLRSPWDTLHFACSAKYFPLTLTLSLREREQQASDWCFADGYWANSGTGVIERRWTILPLHRERAGVRGNRM